MKKKIDVSCLYRISSTRNIEIGSSTYSVNASGATGKSLYPGTRPTRTKTAKYSYALIPCKYWNEDKLFVAASPDNKTIYMEYNDVYSSTDVAYKTALAVNNATTGEWDISVGEHSSSRTEAAIISIIAAVCGDLFTVDCKNDPLLFCDSVYYGYLYDHKDIFNIESEPDKTVVFQAQRACESGLLTTIVGTSPFSPFEPVSTTGSSSKSDAGDITPFINKERLIDYDWDDESRKMIVSPDFLEDFVPTKSFYSLANKISFRLGKVMERMGEGLEGKEAIGKDFLNIRLVGNPGSGKTVLAAALSAGLGIPLYTIPIQKHSEEDVFEGKNKMVEGKLSFVQTDFLKAYKNGGIVVLEEINLADPALIMGALGQAIESPFVLNENGYKTVNRHPMCIIIATQNVGTVGSKAVNQALVSRFNHTYVINDPTEAEFVDRLATRYPDKTVCKWVYKSYTKIKEYLCSSKVSAEDIALALTFRACLGVLEDIEEGATRRDALDKFYAIIYGESPEIAESVLSVINSLPGV